MLTLHTKPILIDRRYFFVGALNLDPRSPEVYTEMGRLIDSEEPVGAVVTGIEEDIPSIAYQVLLDDENLPEWRANIDGEPVTESTEPLADPSALSLSRMIRIS